MADVCIVGAGYTGLSAALHLAERGLNVVVLEAQRVGFGASGRNGGQVGSGQRLDQDALEAMAGQDAARMLWDLAEEAKALVRDLAAGMPGWITAPAWPMPAARWQRWRATMPMPSGWHATTAMIRSNRWTARGFRR